MWYNKVVHERDKPVCARRWWRKEVNDMTIIGMNQSRNAEGEYTTTLPVAEDFQRITTILMRDVDVSDKRWIRYMWGLMIAVL